MKFAVVVPPLRCGILREMFEFMVTFIDKVPHDNGAISHTFANFIDLNQTNCTLFVHTSLRITPNSKKELTNENSVFMVLTETPYAQPMPHCADKDFP